MNRHRPGFHFYRALPSPIGRLTLAASETELTDVFWEGEDGAPASFEDSGRHPVLGEASRQLDEYFAGRRRAFDLPLRPRGTPFQERAWTGLLSIPYGTTLTYAGLAERIDQPGKARAVGAAMGRNPIPVIIPCHRVVGSGGGLTGFGGGLPVKVFLLELESQGGDAPWRSTNAKPAETSRPPRAIAAASR